MVFATSDLSISLDGFFSRPDQLLNPTPDAVDRGRHRHWRCRRPVRPWWFVGVITATKKETSHVEQLRAPEKHRSFADRCLVGNIVTAGGESWWPATRNGHCRRRPW